MNFLNSSTIIGMMNKDSVIDDDSPMLSFFNNRDKKSITVFGQRLKEDIEKKFSNITYKFLNKCPNEKGQSKVYDMYSIIDSSIKYEYLHGKKASKLRNVINRYQKNCYVSGDVVGWYIELMELIEKWRNTFGLKYGRNEQSDSDKNFFYKYRYEWTDEMRSQFDVKLFIHNYEVIGYAVYTKTKSLHSSRMRLVGKYYNVHYCLFRKVSPEYKSFTEYVDWYCFNSILNDTDNYPFVVSWGTVNSKYKGDGWYITHKWKTFNVEEKWELCVDNNTSNVKSYENTRLITDPFEQRAVKYYPYTLGRPPKEDEWDYAKGQREACIKGMMDIFNNPPKELVEKIIRMTQQGLQSEIGLNVSALAEYVRNRFNEQ